MKKKGLSQAMPATPLRPFSVQELRDGEGKEVKQDTAEGVTMSNGVKVHLQSGCS